jgi:hypothetical protein
MGCTREYPRANVGNGEKSHIQEGGNPNDTLINAGSYTVAPS